MTHRTTGAAHLCFALAACVTSVATGCSAKASENVAEEQFVGTWELLSLQTRWPDGRTTEPWGTAPIGRLSYGADENMSALVMDARRNQADGRQVPSELLPNVSSYYGTYSVDTSRHVVVHRVVASIRVSESGILERRFEMRGDTLVIAADAVLEGAAVTHTLRWVRATTP
jgi:hypothetical protein